VCDGADVFTLDDGLIARKDSKLPRGTLTAVDLEVHLSSAPPTNDRVIFDNVGVNQQTFTFAGDGSV
jgi:hypothetical protein